MIDASADDRPVEIDGSDGEGGGQVVRSSLALSAVTGRPLRLTNIRAGRSKPGLLRQHLTGLRAMTAVTDADVDGGHLGSTTLTFTPRAPRGGRYAFEVGSAGSTVLVAQTILPALLAADGPSTVTIGGGTHAAFAPPFDFFAEVYLPMVRRMGGRATCELTRFGFYPAGGGGVVIDVRPSVLDRSLHLSERGGEAGVRVTALVAGVPISVARRECDVVARRGGWPTIESRPNVAEPSGGPGNTLMVTLAYEHVTEMFTAHGRKGVRGEQVARDVVRAAKRYEGTDVPVGPHLADQLLLPMALAAMNGADGSFRTADPTGHFRTHVDVIHRFLPVQISTRREDGAAVRVDVRKSGSGSGMT